MSIYTHIGQAFAWPRFDNTDTNTDTSPNTANTNNNNNNNTNNTELQHQATNRATNRATYKATYRATYKVRVAPPCRRRRCPARKNVLSVYVFTKTVPERNNASTLHYMGCEGWVVTTTT
jgi:hypothetical protein